MIVFLASYHSLFRRNCVICPPTAPSCPVCSENEVCSLVPPSCDTCQHTICVANAATPSTISSSPKSSSSGPNVGAIVGGVVGGLACIAIVTYLVWRYCIKTKRQQYATEDWGNDADGSLGAEKDFTRRRDARASTHTVGSIASTVLTRASNIIQIAYIPGVTNRSAPSTPGLLVPPVPPIPIALSSASSSPRYENEHFFMPGNLRDSTYSGISDRTSYARTSVASTIYGKNAVVSPVPAQTVIRGKAAVVSVRSNGAGASELMPPVPSVDYGKYGANGPPSPAFSVKSTLDSATAATQMRPHVIKVAGGPAQKTGAADNRAPVQNGLPGPSKPMTTIDETPNMEEGPFSDPALSRHQSNVSLSAVIEKASKKPQGGEGASIDRGETPFGDEHEVKE